MGLHTEANWSTRVVYDTCFNITRWATLPLLSHVTQEVGCGLIWWGHPSACHTATSCPVRRKEVGPGEPTIQIIAIGNGLKSIGQVFCPRALERSGAVILCPVSLLYARRLCGFWVSPLTALYFYTLSFWFSWKPALISVCTTEAQKRTFHLLPLLSLLCLLLSLVVGKGHFPRKHCRGGSYHFHEAGAPFSGRKSFPADSLFFHFCFLPI